MSMSRSFLIGLFVLLSAWISMPFVDAQPPATVGLSPDKPAEGPYVEVGGQFMVPYTQRIPGTNVDFEMIPVPGGSFLFGAAEDDPEKQEDEGPQVKLDVSPMWVAKTEISWAEYKEYMKLYSIFKEFEAAGKRQVTAENMADAITAPTELYDPSFTYENGEEPQQPAVTMTQYAAQQYTKWLSLLTGQQYRLPTEAEWEYACRGGTTTRYHWGDSADDIGQYAWYFDNADEGLPHVGTKAPNPFGLHDMHGSVAEWTVNQYTPDGHAGLAKLVAEKGSLNATEAVVWPTESSPCVVRGGSWEMDADDLRASVRLGSDDELWKEYDPNFPLSPWWFTSDPARGVGFRLFRSYDALPAEQITKFWEPSAPNTINEVETRVLSGRGGYGLVDAELVDAIRKAGN
ncbi:MAG: formylglycine-generating enzyme family protein [Planctomycetaceae bacterium]|nr:MAG: formylglycine-generating enzyme family protein [Planctomycetaceae bacterium]